MSWLAAILRGVAALTGLGDATARLLAAAKAKASKPPAPEPPPPLGSGAPDAMAYLKGRTDEQWRQQQKERDHQVAEELARKAAAGDDDARHAGIEQALSEATVEEGGEGGHG